MRKLGVCVLDMYAQNMQFVCCNIYLYSLYVNFNYNYVIFTISFSIICMYI